MSDGLRSRFRALALVAAAAVLLPLGGCGFHPLYGDASPTSALTQLGGVDVVAPETVLGRSLKFNLLDTLNATGDAPASPAYRLLLQPVSYSQDVAIQQNAAVTRAAYVLVVPFSLVDTARGKTVFKSSSRSRSSYNRLESEFANLSAAKDAEERTSQAVAADIKVQLSVFFDRKASREDDAKSGASAH